MSRTAVYKPMQDWQKELLEDNIDLYYRAMNVYGAGKYIEDELGDSVMFSLCSSMNSFNPEISTIGTFIYMQVRWALVHVKRDFAYANAKKQRIFDAMQLKLESEWATTNKGHHRDGDLGDALEKLPPRLKEVVGLYYNNNVTVKECGAAMGLSKQRFSQLLEKTKSHLAKSMSTMKGARM